MSKVAKLYVVATPIGNLGDITVRALATLKEVHLIAAEDTRQSKKLLSHYGIATPLLSLHAHNERARTGEILDLLSSQQNIAYITDAGTPLISDPGAYLVKVVRENGYLVIPIPGPCAAIAALSVAGITQSNFYFEGFLPSKSSQRKERLSALKNMICPLIFYESPHRILAALKDFLLVLGNRHAVIARELTKKFETILEGSLEELSILLNANTQQQRGEFVVIVSGGQVEWDGQEKIEKTLTVLLGVLPLKKAVSVAAELVDLGKNELYQLALTLRDKPT